jgi:hypothetical protein
MTGTYPNLGFDPCPGDLAGYHALADYARRSAATLEASVRTLSAAGPSGSAGPSSWRGQAATAFQAHLDRDVLPLASRASGSVQRAAGTLRAWYLTLAELQDEARALDNRARPYREELAISQRRPGSGPAAAARLDEAKTALAAIAIQADDLHARYLAAVSRTSAQLQDAGNLAPSPPSMLAAMWDDVAAGWDVVAGQVDHFVHDKALLEFISRVCDAISTVAGLLALIPSPFSLVLAGIALGAAGAEMASDGLLAAFDHGSWTSVALDGVAVATEGGWIKATREVADAVQAAGPDLAAVWAPSGRRVAVVPGMFSTIGDALDGGGVLRAGASGM